MGMACTEKKSALSRTEEKSALSQQHHHTNAIEFRKTQDGRRMDRSFRSSYTNSKAQLLPGTKLIPERPNRVKDLTHVRRQMIAHKEKFHASKIRIRKWSWRIVCICDLLPTMSLETEWACATDSKLNGIPTDCISKFDSHGQQSCTILELISIE